MTGAPLSGLGVLVTRPDPEGTALAERLAADGAGVWALPAMDIRPRQPDAAALDLARETLATALFIFVSRNAVRHGIEALGGVPQRCLAVGPSTAAELERAGASLLARSDGFDSEALLALDVLAEPVAGPVFIVRGDGGRPLLGDTLSSRGTDATYLEVYERAAPDPDSAVLAEVLGAWHHGGIDVYTATSVDILRRLQDLLGSEHEQLLAGTALVTASERVIKRAAEGGHRAERILAAAPNDASLADALAAWWEGGQKRTGKAAMQQEDHGQDKQPALEDPESTAPEDPEDPEIARHDESPGNDSRETARGGSGLATVALLLALAALGLSGFMWWLGQGQDDASVTEAARLEGDISRVDTGLQSIESRLVGVEREAADATRRADALRSELADLQSRNRDLETRLASVATEESAASRADGPILAETEYLLRVAVREVGLTGRPDVAAAALAAADRNLAELDEPRLQPVRRQIADDLNALESAERADTAGIALRLGSLANRVETLPLAGSLAPEGSPFGPVDEGAADASGWDRMVGKVKAFFSDMFRVRAVEGDIRPTLAPEEAFFLYRNLELDLKSARLAALNEDPTGYREALRAARGNLERYFDKDDPSVHGTLEILGELEGMSVETRYPDISGSLAALKSVRPGDLGGTESSSAAAPEAGSTETETGAQTEDAPEPEAETDSQSESAAEPEAGTDTTSGEAPEPEQDTSVQTEAASEPAADDAPAAEGPQAGPEDTSGTGTGASPEDDEPAASPDPAAGAEAEAPSDPGQTGPLADPASDAAPGDASTGTGEDENVPAAEPAEEQPGDSAADETREEVEAVQALPEPARS